MGAPRPTRLRGNTFALAAWRSLAAATWLVYAVGRRNSPVVPGALLVATSHPVAAKAIESALGRFDSRRLWRVIKWTEVLPRVPGRPDEFRKEPPGRPDESRKERRVGARVARVWSVQVHAGGEQAILRELEYRVARALEIDGDYTGLPAELSLWLARRTIAAHQVRAVEPTASTPRASAPPFENLHSSYKKAMGLCPPAREPDVVSVAMLDAKPSADLDSVVRGEDDDELAGRPSDHATTTIAIVKDLAPGVQVTSYTVLGTQKRADELGVVNALVRLRDSDVSVVVMPFKLEFGRSSHPKTWRTVIDTLLPDLGPARIVVAAAGNDAKSQLATFPGYMPTVVMVGAVEDDHGGLRIADYSAYKFDHPGPALHVVAPSGAGAIADVAVGTSGATAYAAGVIARTIAQCGLPNCADPARVLRRIIAEGADKSAPFDDVERCGAGLIREVTYDRDVVALQVDAGSPTGDAQFDEVWTSATSGQGRVSLARDLGELAGLLEPGATGSPERHLAVASLLRAAEAVRHNAAVPAMIHLRQSGAWPLDKVAEPDGNVARLLRAALGLPDISKVAQPHP